MAGHWSDLLGRKRLYLLGALLAGAFGFVYFMLMNTAVPACMFVAIVLCYVPRDLMYGPQAALIAECFPARLRYSGPHTDPCPFHQFRPVQDRGLGDHVRNLIFSGQLFLSRELFIFQPAKDSVSDLTGRKQTIRIRLR
jgi:hypothetical protein